MVDFDKLRKENAAKAAAAANKPKADPVKLDHTPITFGLYARPSMYKKLGYDRPLTPSEIAQHVDSTTGEARGEGWLAWAYENVKNRPVCSELLARDCGWKPPYTQSQGLAESRNTNPKALDDPTFDYDDDIPF